MHSLFLSKVPVNEPVQFPSKALWRELPTYKAFFFYISLRFLIKVLLNKKSLLSKALGKRLFIFPKSGAPVETCPFPEPYLACFRGSPVKEAPPSRFPSQSSLRERCPIPRAFLHSSFNVPVIRSPFPVPQRGPCGERFSCP